MWQKGCMKACRSKPNLFPTPESCVETLNNRFPNKSDVTSDEMIKSIKDALSKVAKCH